MRMPIAMSVIPHCWSIPSHSAIRRTGTSVKTMIEMTITMSRNDVPHRTCMVS